MTTITLERVSKEIKNNLVIQDVSVSFLPGRITGLRGINGSGKTMLMRLIAGLIRPTEGKVFINEKQLWKDISFPESMGLLIENPAFLDHYSGLQNLKLLASVKDVISEDQIRKTIQEVGLDPNDKKKYRKYSLGMKQRLGIAAALMEKPDIILLDEPTNALDSDGIALLRPLLQREKDRGALILLSCHDFSILEDLSDEIYMMESGRIVDHVIIEKGEAG